MGELGNPKRGETYAGKLRERRTYTGALQEHLCELSEVDSELKGT